MSEPVENPNFKSDKVDELKDVINYPFPDLTYLREMADGDEVFIKEIITMFVEDTPKMLHLMRESFLSGDPDKLHFTAHKLLPQLTFVGIMAAIPDVKEIENENKLNDALFVVIERAIKTINYGIVDLKKFI